jgi:hypothetical protein
MAHMWIGNLQLLYKQLLFNIVAVVVVVVVVAYNAYCYLYYSLYYIVCMLTYIARFCLEILEKWPCTR